jgi:hypothetical protein
MHARTIPLFFVLTSMACAAAIGQTSVPAHTWATADHTTVLKDFRFGTGETLPRPPCGRTHWPSS